MTLAAARYHDALTEKARSYLHGRGISDESAKVFQLGVVTDPEPEHVPLVGMLSIPYLTRTGVVGFKTRQLETYREPKYMVPAGQKTGMFNTAALFTPLSFVVVCEGELDAVIASQCGLPAVGIPGVQAWKAWHGRMLDGFEHVVVLGDNDVKEDGSNPGRELAERICGELGQATAAWLPAGSDVTDVFLSGGRDAVIGLLPKVVCKMLDAGGAAGVE